jgi:hypothetical protein
MTYRPTVRYDDIYKDYVDEVFRATTLDRNQIIRAALFTAVHSEEFRQVMKPYLKKALPAPAWSLTDDSYWLEQKGERANDGPTENETSNSVDGDDGRDGGRLSTVGEPSQRRTGTFSSGPIRASIGGAVYQID